MRNTWTWVRVCHSFSVGGISIAALLASCGQPPAALVKQAEATPAPSTAPAPDFSSVQTNTDVQTNMEIASTSPSDALPTLQFRRREAQAAFETYLERYRQLYLPSPIPRTQVIDPSQIQASLQTIGQAAIAVKQAEVNLTGILNPNELRQFRAYQNQLANP
jgi:hypothetical protein